MMFFALVLVVTLVFSSVYLLNQWYTGELGEARPRLVKVGSRQARRRTYHVSGRTPSRHSAKAPGTPRPAAVNQHAG